ncbi:hypothetical protein [Flammeovirga sp. SJP92]|uniref:hypothetical protein n=1 Tax=Flammeovirga sp. SJP92 TaxID=1775430 RepID=UPI0007883392|nr:hypothetical protein [Flammeovirga sp. SJP92]KXX68430.1 hypothetical protein AVL50_21925 [Flammeovirga sp. SJP92]
MKTIIFSFFLSCLFFSYTNACYAQFPKLPKVPKEVKQAQNEVKKAKKTVNSTLKTTSSKSSGTKTSSSSSSPSSSTSKSSNNTLCDRAANNMKKHEENILELMANREWEGYKSQLYNYNYNLKNYYKSECGNPDQYQDRYNELDSLITEFKHELQCDEWVNGIIKENKENQENFDKGLVDKVSSATWMFDKIKKLEEADCGVDCTLYKEQAEKWSAIRSDYYFQQNKEELFKKALYTKNYMEEVNKMFERGLDPKVDTFTIKHAAEAVKLDVIKLLVENGVALNFEEGTAFDYIGYSSNDEELHAVLLYLKEKGAKIENSDAEKLANSSVRHADVNLFKAVEKYHKFTWRQYEKFYNKCKSYKVFSKDIATYIGSVLKTKNVENNWSGYYEGIKDATLEAKMRALFNKQGYNYKVVDLKIRSDRWVIERNELTGIVVGKYLETFMYLIDAKGVCGVKRVFFYKSYNGSSYEPMHLGNMLKPFTLVNCSNVN